MLISSIYLFLYYLLKMLSFNISDYFGSYHIWFENIASFGAKVPNSPVASYYSYQPMSIDFIASQGFFVDVSLLPRWLIAPPWVAPSYSTIIYLVSLLTLCLVIYVGFHIARTGLSLYLSAASARSPYFLLLYSFLASSYVFTLFSSSIGSYCLSVMTSVSAALYMVVNVAKYRLLCCSMVACSLLPLLPFQVLAFSPKYPTIILFVYLLLLVSRDIRAILKSVNVAI